MAEVKPSGEADELLQALAAKELEIVREELPGESPRAAVLVGTAWLEDHLIDLIALALPPEETTRQVFLRPISTLGQRIDASHDLGLIGHNERDLYLLLRKLRNRFAHRTSVSFADPEIIALVTQLTPHLDLLPSSMQNSSEEGRELFVTLVSYYAGLLSARLRYAKGVDDTVTRLAMLRYFAIEVDKPDDT